MSPPGGAAGPLTLRAGHVELFVADVARARDFYAGALGFEVLDEQGAVVWLRSGDLELLLRPGEAAERATRYGDAASALVLYTGDLPAAIRALEARGVRFRGHDGSPKCPTFTDPDGHWLQLVDPSDH